MEILYLLIPLSLVLVAVIVWAILWAIRSGQFDDLDGPAYRILDDEPGSASPGSREARTADAGERGPGEGDSS